MMTDKEAQLKAKLLKMKLAASTFKSPKPKFNKRGGRILNPDSDDDRSFGEIRAEEEVRVQNEKDNVSTAKVKVNKLKTAIVRSPDKYRVPRELKHTRSDSDGPLVNKVPFGDENRSTKQQGMDRLVRDSSYDVKSNKVRPPKPKQADRRRIITAQEHNHKISFRGHKIGGFKSASLDEQSGKYAKYWLLNAKETNGNGWGIAAHTAKDNMKKFIGRPLVVTAQSWHGASEYGEEYEHPYLPTNDINAILNHQEKFRVGSIVDVFEDKQGDWFASVEMLPKFASSRLPPFCSPAIYQLDASEAEGQISKWEALHLAALTENPAYGARIALLKGTCVGTDNECKVQFKAAKQEPGIECPIKAKQKKVKAKLSKLKKKQKVSSLKQRIAVVNSETGFNPKGDNPDNAIRDDVDGGYGTGSGLNERDPNRKYKRKPISADDKYTTNRLPLANDFLGRSYGPDRKVGDTLKDKLPGIAPSRVEGTGPDTADEQAGGESELSFKRWNDVAIEGHQLESEKEIDKKLHSIFDGPFDSKYLHPSDNDIDVDTEVEWNLDEYHEDQGDTPLTETKTTSVYDNSLASIYGLAEEGFTGNFDNRDIVGDPRKWEQAKIKLQQYMPIGENDPDDILNFMLDRGIDSFSSRGISDVSRKNAERFSKLKRKQKVSKVKARLAAVGLPNDFDEKENEDKILDALGNRRKRPLSPLKKREKKVFDYADTQNRGEFSQEERNQLYDYATEGKKVTPTGNNAELSSTLKKKFAKLKARLAVDTSKIKRKKYFNDKTLDRAYNVTMQGGIEDTDKTFDNPAKRKSPFENFQIRKKIDNSATLESPLDALVGIGNNSIVSNPNIGTNDDKKASGSTVINSFKNKRMKKIAKLKLKLANLGDENMTYQDSKKVKIHKKKHPEVRKAKSSVEDILRGKGRSVDGSHAQSTFLSTKGDFIGGGDKLEAHRSQVGLTDDNQLTDFQKETGLIRVQNFPINRAGDKKMSLGINSKVNNIQLKSIKDLETEGKNIGFSVGDVGKEITGEGYRDLTKILREKKFLG